MEAQSGDMKVIIVGGGIAGLSLALRLHQVGIAACVYEAVANPSPVGAGMNLQPTAVRELTELGLGDELARVGLATGHLSLFNKFGQLICREPRGLGAGYRWPQYSIHRGELQMLLLRAVRGRMGSGAVRCGLTLADIDQTPDKAVALFRDQDGKDVRVEGDVLVGADGIRSTVRRHLHPHEGQPRFGGQVLWRGEVEARPFLDGATMIIAGHLHQRAIVYPMGAASRSGMLRTNWVCQVDASKTAPPPEEWNRQTTPEQVLARFGTWRFPWLDVAALVAATTRILEFPLVDRDPVDRWTEGRITLIGDAAHPMYPIGSQAGSQAVIDASVLTAWLLAISDPCEALLRYDAVRRPAMQEVTLRNRAFGPEAAMQLVEERGPNGFDQIEEVISAQELEAITTSFSRAAGLDVDAVNGRRSFV
jgi:5-methylphenazine-1-carboxylate 1-monooxygenase